MERPLNTRYVVGFGFKIHKERTWVALVRKSRPAWQAGLLNGIGGKVELGESPIGTMVREWQEETSVAVAREHWRSFHYARYRSGAKVHFYAALVPDMDIVNPDPTEPVDFYDVAELIGKRHQECLYNLPYLIPMAMILLSRPLEDVPLEG